MAAVTRDSATPAARRGTAAWMIIITAARRRQIGMPRVGPPARLVMIGADWGRALRHLPMPRILRPVSSGANRVTILNVHRSTNQVRPFTPGRIAAPQITMAERRSSSAPTWGGPHQKQLLRRMDQELCQSIPANTSSFGPRAPWQQHQQRLACESQPDSLTNSGRPRRISGVSDRRGGRWFAEDIVKAVMKSFLCTRPGQPFI